MSNKISKYIVFAALTLIFTACSAATGSRYSKTETKEEISVTKPPSELKEEYVDDKFNFDMTPYKTKMEINTPKMIKVNPPASDEEIWYSYDQDKNTEPDSLTVTKSRGYRVQVIATDDLDEANQIKSEIYFITNQKHVYVSFEPPFYKVKVGDYTQISDANNLQFKLNQMGYSESRVVTEEVNIFQ